jgi:hypothetical protein
MSKTVEFPTLPLADDLYSIEDELSGLAGMLQIIEETQPRGWRESASGKALALATVVAYRLADRLTGARETADALANRPEVLQ